MLLQRTRSPRLQATRQPLTLRGCRKCFQLASCSDVATPGLLGAPAMLWLQSREDKAASQSQHHRSACFIYALTLAFVFINLFLCNTVLLRTQIYYR